MVVKDQESEYENNQWSQRKYSNSGDTFDSVILYWPVGIRALVKMDLT